MPPMSLTRRHFLQNSLWSLAALHLGACAHPFLRPSRQGRGKVIIPSVDSSKFSIYDWDSGELKIADHSLRFPHSATQNPRYMAEVVFFEQWSPSCSLFDLSTMSIREKFTLPEDRWFYGHGAFSPDGQLLLTTEVTASDKATEEVGYVTVRDASTLKKKYEMSSFGHRVHDVAFLNDDLIAVTTNGAGDEPSYVNFIAWKTGTLVRKVSADPSDGIFGHIYPVAEDEVFTSGTKEKKPSYAIDGAPAKHGLEATLALKRIKEHSDSLPAPMYKIKLDGTITKLWDSKIPNRFKDNFSVCTISKKDSLYASAHGGSDNVIIWKNNSIVKIIEKTIPQPFAIAVSQDGEEMIVGSPRGLVSFYSTRDYSEIPHKAFQLQVGTGPLHFLRLS
jgi:hypothetical protein